MIASGTHSCCPLQIHCILTLRASADRCRRYAESKMNGFKEYPPPTRYVPRRYASAEDLTIFDTNSANDFDWMIQTSADECRRYSGMTNNGKTRQTPRRYASVEELTSFAPDSPTDLAFEIKKSLSNQDLDADPPNSSAKAQGQTDPLNLKTSSPCHCDSRG